MAIRNKKKKSKSRFRDKVGANTKRQKEREGRYGPLKLPKGISIFKEDPDSRVRLDFLPYEVTDPKHPDRDDDLEIAVPGSLWYRRPYRTHRNIGVENNSFACRTSIGKRCPICEYRASLIKQGKDWQDDDVKALKSSERVLYCVIPRQSKKYDEEPHIWDISSFLFQEKLNDELLEDPEYQTFPDPDEGLTLRIRFNEATLGRNKFADTSRIDFEERKNKITSKDLKAVPNLDEIVEVKSYKELEKIFFEVEDEVNNEEQEQEEDDSTDEEKSLKRKRKSTKSLNEMMKENDEEDDEEDADGDEDDEVDNKDEDEDDEEEIEEEVSSRHRRKSKRELASSKDKSSKKPKERSKSKKEKEKDDRCPANYRFGYDCDEKPECEECDVWDDCMDYREVLEKNGMI